ncbi:polyketide synthase [Aspergillus sclerotialis]|uniref:Polyketide synthase n=1 Tax=Aspergillus sclerotialis TaxID=2070753 RepID=A0A3A2ZJT0_9EURO|nr:polyketide synthase [Aspergillus sclerotialis]
MNEPLHVYLFGDQTSDFVPELRELFKVKEGCLLGSFFERTNIALRHEIAKNPREVQETIPCFSRLSDLLAQYASDTKAAPILESTLMTLTQLASFIRYYGDNSDRSRIYPSPPGHVVLGICTGLLAASAVASSSGVADLVSLAVDTVVIAFRTGVQVARMKDHVDGGSEFTQSWSYVVSNMESDTAMSHIERLSKSLNTRQDIPTISQPFISAIGPSSVTVSGIPRYLKELFGSTSVPQCKASPISIHAPYHAPHLYKESVIEHILGDLTTGVSRARLNLPIISSHTGQTMKGVTFVGLLRTALSEILLKPTRWDHVLSIDNTSWNLSQYSSCAVLPFCSNASQILAQALRDRAGVTVEVHHAMNTRDIHPRKTLPAPSGRPEQSKIAIIGFSGRFPRRIVHSFFGTFFITAVTSTERCLPTASTLRPIMTLQEG